jgi:type II secretory ATPase GspE/PulE/Tfp pilus assembly ATPase PilB-like protein
MDNKAKITQNNKIIIESIHDLPEGSLITAKGNVFALPDTQKGGIALWQVTGSSELWMLLTEEADKGPFGIQLVQQTRAKNHTITKRIIVKEGLLRALYERAEKAAEDERASGSLQDSHVVKSFNHIMSLVLKERASDVHIEKRDETASIKIRKNGEIIKLSGYETMSPSNATELCTVIYNVLAEADSKEVAFNETLIQQGAVKTNVQMADGTISEIKLRFQSVPVYPNGFDVIMRVLPVGRNEKTVTMEELGYEQSQIKMILECVSRAVGAVIIAGVTGSGKSTTLKNLLLWVHEDREFSEKIFTVEDPPEYIIPGVSQIPVARRKDDAKEGRKPFEDAIKACMRGDPDVIMVGEIRDNTTGDLLKKAVQSGHRVLTTVHAPSALGVIDRLLDFGLSNSTMGSQEFIAGLMYQRLLGKLCEHCSVPLLEATRSTKASRSLFELTKRIEKTLKDAEEDASYLGRVRLRGPGCQHCQTGVTGRTVCAEVVKPDLEILAAFQEQNIMRALQHLRRTISDGHVTTKNMVGKSAMAHAIYKMFSGQVDPVELERSFGTISLSEITGLPKVNADDYNEEEFKF